MSDSQVYAYYVEEDFVEKNLRAENKELMSLVLADENGMINQFSPRFSGKSLSEAIQDLFVGTQESDRPFHYAFALWIIIDSLVSDKPNNPQADLYEDLYDLNEILAELESYPLILNLFKALNGEVESTYPLKLKEWADMPCFAYVSVQDFEGIDKEIKSMKLDFKKEKDWTLDVEDPDEILHILRWIEKARKANKNLLLVLEGDL